MKFDGGRYTESFGIKKHFGKKFLILSAKSYSRMEKLLHIPFNNPYMWKILCFVYNNMSMNDEIVKFKLNKHLLKRKSKLNFVKLQSTSHFCTNFIQKLKYQKINEIKVCSVRGKIWFQIDQNLAYPCIKTKS